MNKGKLLLAVLAGVAAGALLGVLFAPDKGSETRKKISKKGKKYADGIGEKVEDLISHVTDKFGEVKEDVSDLTGKSKTRHGETKKDMKASAI